MAARSSVEEQKHRRRRRLVKGLLVGGAAVGIPALANALVARRNRNLSAPLWGRSHRYAWRSGEIAFQKLGEGSPILLLHSFGPGQDSEEWREVAELLARGNQVFVPDLLGWGRSEKPRLAYDAELYVQFIQDFLADVVVERCVVAASGLPAAYAIQTAIDRPEMVRGLALVVPSGLEIHGDEPDLKDALVHRMLRLPVLGASALNLYTSHTALAQYLRREVFRAVPEMVTPTRIDHYHRSSHQPGSQVALAAYLSGYLNHRVEEGLNRLTSSPWIAWGRKASSPPVEIADLWLQRVPTAELEVFEHCGNYPHLESPARFCQRLEAHLAHLPS